MSPMEGHMQPSKKENVENKKLSKTWELLSSKKAKLFMVVASTVVSSIVVNIMDKHSNNEMLLSKELKESRDERIQPELLKQLEDKIAAHPASIGMSYEDPGVALHTQSYHGDGFVDENYFITTPNDSEIVITAIITAPGGVNVDGSVAEGSPEPDQKFLTLSKRNNIVKSYYEVLGDYYQKYNTILNRGISVPNENTYVYGDETSVTSGGYKPGMAEDLIKNALAANPEHAQ